MSELILCLIDYLDMNLYNDISIDEISLYFGYDKTYLMKKFKSETGMSIKTYVNSRKIYNSLPLLSNDDLLLKVALNSGYNSLEYYSEMFTHVMGVSPSVFRKYPDGDLTKGELEQIGLRLLAMNEFNNYLAEQRIIRENKNQVTLKLPTYKNVA